MTVSGERASDRFALEGKVADFSLAPLQPSIEKEIKETVRTFTDSFVAN